MMETIALSNGLVLPTVGFGTYKITGADGPDIIAEAIRCGYRLLDCASFYGNEAEVGEGIRRSGIDRKELFLTTKAWRDEMGYDNIKAAFQRSLARLGVDYIDLYLIHWPSVPCKDAKWNETNAESWRAMEELYESGLIRAIGVSNFLPEHLEELAKTAKYTPMVNQIEYHPGWTQPDVIDYCRAHGIVPEAWSPMGRTRVIEAPLLVELSEKYGLNPGQLCIRFATQNGVIPIPKSTHRNRMMANMDVFGVTISPTDMERIAQMPKLGWSGEDPKTQTKQLL